MRDRIWRSTLILSFAACYIMWGMLFLKPPLPPLALGFILQSDLCADSLDYICSNHITGAITSSYQAETRRFAT